jgi:hypothetical protein
LFEENLSDEKSSAVVKHLQDKYKLISEGSTVHLSQPLPHDFVQSIAVTLNQDVATSPPIKLTAGRDEIFIDVECSNFCRSTQTELRAW